MRSPVLTLAMIAFAAAQAWAGERYVVIVSGVSGGEKYATQQQKWRNTLAAGLKADAGVSGGNLVILDEESTGTSRATAENVRRLMTDLKRRATNADTSLLILFGHGSIDGTDAKFNLVGPDMTAAEWQATLDGFPGRLVIVNSSSASFPFIEQLSQKGRIVITATDSSAQRFTTVFPEYFVRALTNLSSDLDKNGRVSIWEAFAAASGSVKQHYEQRGQLSTERPLLDDDGDHVGREANAPGGDGSLARVVYLDADPGSSGNDEVMAGLERQRNVLEHQLEELKARKPLLTDEQYEVELEKLLVQLARTARRIRARS